MTSELRFSIETLASVNMGDHGERLRTSHTPLPGETVEELVTRVFPALSSGWAQHDPTDELVIRVLVEPDGTPSGQTPRFSSPPF